MGKVLVLYDSASGNTAKMAALVAEGAEGIPGIEGRLRKVDAATADDVLWCDGLALGSPTNMGLLSWKMKRFWSARRSSAVVPDGHSAAKSKETLVPRVA